MTYVCSEAVGDAGHFLYQDIIGLLATKHFAQRTFLLEKGTTTFNTYHVEDVLLWVVGRVSINTV